jgi:alpha-tubulin suppressor-like RCC1 family protein
MRRAVALFSSALMVAGLSGLYGLSDVSPVSAATPSPQSWGRDYAGNLGYLFGHQTGPSGNCQTPHFDSSTTNFIPAPVQPPPTFDWTGLQAMSAGNHFSLALVDRLEGSQEVGVVYAWGDDSRGELGPNFNPGTPPVLCTPVPQLVGACSTISGGATAVATGAQYALARCADGEVEGWGENGGGQLGSGCMASSCTTPVLIVGLTGVMQVAAGGRDAVALLNDHTVWTWGYGGEGQLGNNKADTGFESTPQEVVKVDGTALHSVTQISAGNRFDTALVTNGSATKVFDWGLNASGQLGDNSTANSNVAVKVQGLPDGVTQIATGGNETSNGHTLALVAGVCPNNIGSGCVYAWGSNTSGQTGQGDFDSSDWTAALVRSSPGQPLLGATFIAAGGAWSTALAASTVYVWGSDADGELGDCLSAPPMCNTTNKPYAQNRSVDPTASFVSAGPDDGLAF